MPGDRIASREEFNLYNPALIAVVQSEAARGYFGRSSDGMPLPLVFSASAIALFGHLRSDLPSSTRTHLAKWITDNPEFRPEFQRLVRSLVPPLREGLLFALAHNQIQFEGSNVLAQGRRRSLPGSLSQETRSILRTAEFIGRWFGATGSTSTTLSLLGFGS